MSEETAALDPILSAPDSPGEAGTESAPEGKTAPEGEPTQAEETVDGGEKAPEKGHSEAFKKLLSKYGGDVDKLAEGIFEQYNSAARTHEELVEMRGVLEELRSNKAAVEETEKAVAEDPYVKEVNSDLASINEQAIAVAAEMKVTVTEYQKQVMKVAKLEGALSKADDSDRPEVQQDLRDAKNDLKQLERDYKEKERDYKRHQSEWNRLQRSLRDAEGQARSRVDRERQDAQRLQSEAKLTRQEYNDVLRTEAKNYGLDPSSKAYNFIDSTFRSRLSQHMRALQAQGVQEGIDIPKAVGILMKEYAEATGLTRKFSTASTEKAAAATPKRDATPAEPGAKGTKKEGEMSAAEWRTRARQLMP